MRLVLLTPYFLYIMPKLKRNKGGVCPNPCCNTKYFATERQLNQHIGGKTDCSAYVTAIRRQQQQPNQHQQGASALRGALCFVASQNGMATTSICPPVGLDIPTPAATLQNADSSTSSTSAPGSATFLDDDVSFANNDSICGNFEHSDFAELLANNDDLVVPPQERTFTTSRRVETTLMKLLTEIDAPLYAFKSVMEWAEDAHHSEYGFTCQNKSYHSQINNMQSWLGMGHLRPEEVVVDLPGAHGIEQINVTVFDFVKQVTSLLADSELNCGSNLVINSDNPFARYTPPDGKLGECISGSWYNHAWDHMETMTNNTFMIPIILYIDKTVISQSGKLSLHPVQMSLGIFTEKARRKANAWRPLGYIANEDIYYSGAERNDNTADVKNERLHRILDAILKSFKEAQQPNALQGVPVQLGQYSKKVNLYVPLQFIIGDVEGGDVLCSRYMYRRAGCQRLCRTCDVSTEDAIRTDVMCTRILLEDVRNLVADQNLDALRQLAQRPTFNAFYDIDCGDDPYGVFSMIMTEALHALEQGLMPYMMKQLMQQLGPLNVQAELDRLIKTTNDNPRQHGYHGFPRFMWKEGVSTLTMLTGDQKVGKMFAVTVLAATRRGEAFFTTHLGGTLQWQRMLYCFSQVLSYWAWLKQDTYWECGDTTARDEARDAIDTMIRQLQTLFPRDDGLGWNLTKVHEQRHVPDDIHRHGAHYNVHSGPQEHNHIENGKKAAERTQKRKHKLDFQTGHRVVDRLIIQQAFNRVADAEAGSEPDATADYGTKLASKAEIRIVMPDPSQPTVFTAEVVWKREKNGKYRLRLQDDILRFLVQSFFADHAVDHGTSRILTIPMFTEYHQNDTVYRAHPDYRGESAYYDWANVNWHTGDDETGQPIVESVVGQVLLFFEDPSDRQVKTIIHSTDPDKSEQHGVFFTLHEMELIGPDEPRLHIATVDALGSHAMMVPYTVDALSFIEVWERSEWPACFLGLVNDEV
jgi:hypothetical protein